MARKYEAQRLLVSGMSPSRVSAVMGISIKSVMQYLQTVVGEGRLRRSDILFAIPREKREQFKEAEAAVGMDEGSGQSWLRYNRPEADLDDFYAYVRVRDEAVPLEDMYSSLRHIELALHKIVRQVLEHEFGTVDDSWWRSGVPESIRCECAALQEKDQEPSAHKFCYTTFIHLKEIVDKKWTVFSKYFPPTVRHDKPRFIEGLVRINRIRNRVMHPVRDFPPTEEDFEFLRDFLNFFSGQHNNSDAEESSLVN